MLFLVSILVVDGSGVGLSSGKCQTSVHLLRSGTVGSLVLLGASKETMGQSEVRPVIEPLLTTRYRTHEAS